MIDNDNPFPSWQPNFDPYDALIQLGKNQEFLFNREAIHTAELNNLKAELNTLHNNMDVLHKQLQNLQYDVAILKSLYLQKTTVPTPYLDTNDK